MIAPGVHSWGSLSVRSAWPGVLQQATLRVCGPGTTERELWWWRVWCAWPVLGAGLVVGVVVVGAALVPPVVALVVGLGLHALGAVALAGVTRHCRRDVRELRASVVRTPEAVVTTGDPARVRAVAARLCALERARAAGVRDDWAHRQRWAEVWRALPER